MNVKIKQITVIIVFLIFIGSPYIIWIFAKDNFRSENLEKRELAEKPEFSLSAISSFPDAFEAYMNDHLPFRNQLIQGNSLIEYYVFHSSMDDRVVIGKDGWLFYNSKTDGDPIGYYRGEQLLSEEAVQQIVSYLETAEKELEDQGIEFVLFIAPEKARIYADKMPAYYGEPSDSGNPRQIIDYLRQNTDIRVVYPYEELMQALRESPSLSLYQKTDTHWNKLGAYISSAALLKELGITISGYGTDGTDVIETEEVCGDLGQMLNLVNKIDPGKAYEVTGYNKNGMINDIWDHDTEFRYHSQNGDPRKLFIIRDSFGSAMSDVVGSQFQTSVMIHRQIFENAMIEDEKPDILVYEVTERHVIARMLEFYDHTSEKSAEQ